MDHQAPHGLIVDPATCRGRDLAPAVAWLRAGGIVAYPTDTFYGLAVDPSSAAAVEAIFEVKGRAADAALPFVASSLAQVEDAGYPLTAASRRLAAAFWPGPLSIVCDAPASVVAAAQAKDHSVAIRVPDHIVARALAEAFGAPITATSANRSGQPPAQTAAALAPLARDPRVLVVDGGATPGGTPSTIVDARVRPPRLVRAGVIVWDRVLRSLDE